MVLDPAWLSFVMDIPVGYAGVAGCGCVLRFWAIWCHVGNASKHRGL
jgi:hypothetical protein